MKIIVNGLPKELSDTDILALGIGAPPAIAGLLNDLLKRAKRAEHKCEIWEKMAIQLHAKLKAKEEAK